MAAMVKWDFYQAPRLAVQAGARCVVHATNTGGRTPRRLPSVLVVHDTMVLDHPHLFDPKFRRYAQLTFGASVKMASMVVVPSDHSRTAVLSRWPGAQVTVIPWCRPEAMTPARPDRSSDILVVASADKHKRIPMGLHAAAAAQKLTGKVGRCTVVVRSGNDTAALNRAVGLLDPSREWIDLRSNVSGPELDALYANTGLLLVPSIDEGFCLPALEATVAGVPVVHTGRGALADLYGNGMQPSSDTTSDQASLIADICLAFTQPTNELVSRQQAAIANYVPTELEFATRWRNVLESVCEL